MLSDRDQKTLIRLASSLPPGDKTRRAIVAGLGALFKEFERAWDLSTEQERKVKSMFRRAVTLDENVRAMGNDKAQQKWKRDRIVIDTKDESPEAQAYVEDLAQKYHMEATMGSLGWILRSKK